MFKIDILYVYKIKVIVKKNIFISITNRYKHIKFVVLYNKLNDNQEIF